MSEELPDLPDPIEPEANPLLPSRLDFEREVTASTTESMQAAFMSRLSFQVQAMLGYVLARDAKQFHKSRGPKPLDADRVAWDKARLNVIADYKRLFESVQPASGPSKPVQGVVIDVPSTVRPARTAQSS
jgi:hypothetical protein